jgi:hypothetical protein
MRAVCPPANSCTGHNLAMEIQATLPHPPDTVAPMMLGVVAAYVVTPLCYFTVAISGYWVRRQA